MESDPRETLASPGSAALERSSFFENCPGPYPAANQLARIIHGQRKNYDTVSIEG